MQHACLHEERNTHSSGGLSFDVMLDLGNQHYSSTSACGQGVCKKQGEKQGVIAPWLISNKRPCNQKHITYMI